jgi:hypothetical protein
LKFSEVFNLISSEIPCTLSKKLKGKILFKIKLILNGKVRKKRKKKERKYNLFHRHRGGEDRRSGGGKLLRR